MIPMRTHTHAFASASVFCFECVFIKRGSRISTEVVRTRHVYTASDTQPSNRQMISVPHLRKELPYCRRRCQYP